MKEYQVERGQKVDLKRLEAPFLSDEDYAKAHSHLVIACHDVFISYEDGFLLVERKVEPAAGMLWPIGGRKSRGMPESESLRRTAKKETGLDLDNIVELGRARTYFQADPFGHGMGTDTENTVYAARGIGNLVLDSDHTNPRIITGLEFNRIQDSLHPYVSDFLRLAFLNPR